MNLVVLERRLLFYLLLVVFFLYASWAIIIPYNSAPDEYQRFDIGHFVYKYHELPVAGDPRLEYGSYGITYASTPSFPYIVGGVLMILFDDLVGDDNLFLINRFISVISGVLAVYFVYKICDKLAFRTSLKLFITCIFAFIPQYAFINSYVNLDSFTIMVVALILFLCLKGCDEGWTKLNVFSLGLSISLCLLSYLNGYVVIPIATTIFLLTLKRDVNYFPKVALLGITIFVFAGWWFIRSYILYDGDILGGEINKILSEKYAIEELKPSNRETLFKQGLSIWEMLLNTNWIKATYYSFWAAFGLMDVWLKENFYNTILWFHILSLVGLLINCIKEIYSANKGNYSIRKLLYKNKVYIGLFLMFLITVGLSIYYSYFNDFQPQGRYLFPSLISVIIFLGIGFDSIVPKVFKNYFYLICVCLMFWLNLYSLFKIVFFHYYG